VKRQRGYAEHPQNCLPAPIPLVAVRSTISLSHLGQNLRVSRRRLNAKVTGLVPKSCLRRFHGRPSGSFEARGPPDVWCRKKIVSASGAE
jgi:hypothetical protein